MRKRIEQRFAQHLGRILRPPLATGTDHHLVGRRVLLDKPEALVQQFRQRTGQFLAG